MPPKIDEAEARIAEARWRPGRVLLDLSGLELTSVPDSARTIAERLDGLSVAASPIAELPSWIGECRHLAFLSVNRTSIRSLPAEFASLTRLRVLAMCGMQLTELPSRLRGLESLTHLSLADNQLSELPDWFGELRNLSILGLRGNRLASLPDSIRRLRRLSSLDLGDNPDLRLPTEMIAARDPRQLVDYYFQTRGIDARDPLNEFRLVLVGHGGVGKTSLVHRLTTGQYKELARTPGVSITQWPVQVDGTAVRAHVWDFGGQEIMHGTHRFFMTARALYLILVTGREGTEDHDVEYWLSMVRSFASDAPIIVLLHKSGEYRFQLNTGLLRKKYGANLVFLETDSKTGEGIDALTREISRRAATLEGLRDLWPSAWWRVKDELPHERRNWLTFDEFRKFASDRGVTDAREHEPLADHLNSLGLMLSFTKDENLRHFGILNPQWVTQGIYRILNEPSLRDAGGRIAAGAFAGILPRNEYPPELHGYLLRLMRKFQLCHPLDEQEREYLVPELLTKEEPAGLDQEFPPEKCLGFVYRYETVLPEGLLPRFIVNTYLHQRPSAAWRTGVVLERSNCRALVRGDVQERTITIRVAGNGDRRELLGIIREYFERIHASYQKLPLTEWVAVPGHPETLVSYALLLKYEQAERKTIVVEIGDGLVDWSVEQLLDGADIAGTPRGRERDSAANRLAIPLFVCYAREDKAFLAQFLDHMEPHKRRRQVQVWSDRLLVGGDRWEEEIFAHIDAADIVVLLVSIHLLNSAYTIEKELARARGKVIVPIIIRPCPYESLFGDLHVIQAGNKAVSEHRDRDGAWRDVTRDLDKVIAKVRGDLEADASRQAAD